MSCLTFAEIRFGIERLALEETFRRTLTEWLDHELRGWFAGPVLDIDEAAVLAWRRLVEAGKARRHTFPQPDLFIAATALVHGLGVATRNTVDFLVTGVPLRNPWDPA